MDRWQRRATISALAFTLIASAASAEGPTRVRVVLPACRDAFDRAEVLRVLRIELASDGVSEVVEDDATGAAASIRVDATPCGPDVRKVGLTVADFTTGKTVRRDVDVGDLDPPARPRALALATAELLRASWSELSMPDAPVKASDAPESVVRAVKLRPPPAEPKSAAAPTVAPAPVLVRAGLDVRAFPAYQSVVAGPAVAVSAPLFRTPLRAHVGGAAGFGRAYDSLGTIDLTLVTGNVGLSLSGGSENVRVDVGPVFALGGAWASGDPAPGATSARASAVVATTQLAGSIAAHIGAGFWGVVSVDGGWVLAGLDAIAGSRTATGFDGPLLGATVGFAHEL